MKSKIILALTFFLVITAACAPASTPPPAPTLAPIIAPTVAPTIATVAPPSKTATATLAPGQTEIVLMTHDSFAASEDVIAAFEKANNAKVRVLKAGDAGKALNQAILTKNNPLADAFFGVDNTFLSRALKADLFAPYKAAGIEKIPAEFKLDAQNRVTPIDYGDVCLNYDSGWFSNRYLTPPAKLEDLTNTDYKGLLVVENPATSSPGLAFLLATVAHFGADKYLDYWKKLRANNVLVSEGWSDAYYNKSTWSGKGTRPIVLSYATSPAAEVFFSGGKATTPPTANVLGDDACFRQIEFAGVLSGAKNPALAQKLIDYMLATRFQEDVPAQMFVFPVNADAKLPDFYKFAERPKKSATLSAETIDANREKWINDWTSAVLR
ncbi:MAG: thiamine ABC transporter substrate-binding protein [Chloroflexi bacterium]|nr:thiamine ABC transporter substrate-binding protein [Chloroflexota bacterium]